MSPEKLALLRDCVQEGWPLIQIKRTYGTGWRTMRKYFPDYRGMDNVEAAKLGAQSRRTSLALRNMNHT